MSDDISFFLHLERARRATHAAEDIEELRGLTLQVIELLQKQREVTRALLNANR